MFLRRCERRKNGKRHTCWALVESYGTGRGSRQRVVAYLGELKASERSGWARLGRRLSGKRRPQPSLADPPQMLRASAGGGTKKPRRPEGHRGVLCLLSRWQRDSTLLCAFATSRQ
jgi:hypothetical protein